MIFPVRCMTCNQCIGDQWIEYQNIVNTQKSTQQRSYTQVVDVPFLQQSNEDVINKKTPERVAFEKLGIHRMCCRRHFLCHIEMIDII